MMTRDIQQEIQTELTKIEATKGVTIIHAIESGSRAWGFPSPDSDYDVRFVYMHSIDWYLSVFDRRDVIELPLDKVLDINGWDLKKACLLLTKSNGALYEWLESPIIYRQCSSRYAKFKELANLCIRATRLFYHYRAMLKHTFLGIKELEEVKLKTYLYALRPAFCCEWLLKNRTQPPMLFSTLASSYFEDGDTFGMKPCLVELLDKKAMSNESTTMHRASAIDAYLEDRMAYFENNPPENQKNPDNEIVDEFFKNILKMGKGANPSVEGSSSVVE